MRGFEQVRLQQKRQTPSRSNASAHLSTKRVTCSGSPYSSASIQAVRQQRNRKFDSAETQGLVVCWSLVNALVDAYRSPSTPQNRDGHPLVHQSVVFCTSYR
jgi:hypothetical protein